MSSLFAVLAMDWRRNSGEDEQEDKKDVRRMQEGWRRDPVCRWYNVRRSCPAKM